MRSRIALALVAVLALVGGPSAFAGPEDSGKKGAPAEKIDLNTADVEQLITLPGVGEATAKKIVAGRPYASVDDLAAAGVPAATIEKIKGLVTVSKPKRGGGDAKPSGAGEKRASPSGLLDLNRATEDELTELPGVGDATAAKIVAGRPYASVDDLAKAGVSAKTIDKIRALVTVKPVKTKPTPTPAPTGSSDKPSVVDLNTATLDQLVELPGVGEVTAKKIIAGRPYGSIDELSNAGVGAATIAKIKAAGATVGAKPPAPTPEPGAAPGRRGAAKVDLNSATEDELLALPGVGEVTAGKIVAGRPYASVDDLERAGLSEKMIAKIESLVTVGGKALPPQPKGDPAPGGGEGKVWVNLRSGVFHPPTSRWYGRTKEGQYMTEAQARDKGYRAAGETPKDDDEK